MIEETLETINGDEIPFYIDLVTPITTYGPDVVFPGNFVPVCNITNNGLSIQSDIIDTSGKCTGKSKTNIAGKKGWSFTTDLNAVRTPENSDWYSRNSLQQLADDQTFFWGATYDTDLDEVRYGVVWIPNYEEANPTNEKATATATFQGTGKIWNQVSTS